MMVDYPHDSGRSLKHYVSTLDFIISINNEVLPQNRKKYSLLLKKTKIDSIQRIKLGLSKNNEAGLLINLHASLTRLIIRLALKKLSLIMKRIIKKL